MAIVDGDIPPHVRVHILDKGQYVYLYFNKDKPWPKFTGNLKHSEIISTPIYHFVVIGKGTFHYGKSRIVITANDVIINDVEMGEYINAVVDPDESVSLGAYIRTFQ